MPTPHPKRSPLLIYTLAAICFLTVRICGSALSEMRRDELDRQLYAAVEYGDTSEVAALLNQGADPNFVPHAYGDQTGLSALLTGLQRGRITLRIKNGMPIIGQILNGFDSEGPRAKLNTQQFKKLHLIPPPITCRDPFGKLRVLLAHHADPNCSYFDSNPLIHAVGMNRADVVQLLLQYGADPDAPTPRGDTARKATARSGYRAIQAALSASNNQARLRK